jgi:hypothetical protein
MCRKKSVSVKKCVGKNFVGKKIFEKKCDEKVEKKVCRKISLLEAP